MSPTKTARFDDNELVVVDDEQQTQDELVLDPLRAAAQKYLTNIPFTTFDYDLNPVMISNELSMLMHGKGEPEVTSRWVIFTQTCMRIYESEELEMAKPAEPLVQIPLSAISEIVSE